MVHLCSDSPVFILNPFFKEYDLRGSRLPIRLGRNTFVLRMNPKKPCLPERRKQRRGYEPGESILLLVPKLPGALEGPGQHRGLPDEPLQFQLSTLH